MDAIVFSQDELINAISDSAADIYICDNSFSLPSTPFVTYTSIGKVSAKIDLDPDECKKNGIYFFNFTPKYAKGKILAPVIKNNTHHSFKSSFASNCNVSSAYRFSTSYRFVTSYNFTTSYRLASSYSYATIFKASFASSFKPKPHRNISYDIKNIQSYESDCIFVNGYGINLI